MLSNATNNHLFLCNQQAGCVHFSPPNPSCEIRVLILLYTAEKKAFLGFVPNNQPGFVDRLKKIISSQKQQTRQGMVRTINGMKTSMAFLNYIFFFSCYNNRIPKGPSRVAFKEACKVVFREAFKQAFKEASKAESKGASKRE